MAPFTALATGFAPQLNMSEIVYAVNERRAAAVASGATGLPDAIPATAASVQSFQGGAVKPVHLLIQELLEALAPKYVDHGASVPVGTPYTLATWRAAAGLHADGFRRATVWGAPVANPTFSHGLIQAGDIAGYWIWADIVLGLQALQWTRKVALGRYATERKNISATIGGGESYADFKTRAAGLFAAATFVAGGGNLRVFFVDLLSSTISIDCIRSKPQLTLVAGAPVSASVEFWLKPKDFYGDNSEFWDADGRAFGTYFLHDTEAMATDDTVCASDVWTWATVPDDPITASGVAAADDHASSVIVNFNNDSAALIRWNFSRT